MEIQVDILLDPNGFLRRECPTCEREFKWFSGATSERPDDFVDPDVYFCPYCGIPSGKDTWWTPAQLEYAQQVAAGPVLNHLAEEFARGFGSRRRRSGFQIKVSKDGPESPDPIVDPDDMLMITPPCHPFEPLKIDDNWTSSLHCLICGTDFEL
jgi:hypothetical protein